MSSIEENARILDNVKITHFFVYIFVDFIFVPASVYITLRIP